MVGVEDREQLARGLRQRVVEVARLRPTPLSALSGDVARAQPTGEGGHFRSRPVVEHEGLMRKLHLDGRLNGLRQYIEGFPPGGDQDVDGPDAGGAWGRVDPTGPYGRPQTQQVHEGESLRHGEGDEQYWAADVPGPRPPNDVEGSRHKVGEDEEPLTGGRSPCVEADVVARDVGDVRQDRGWAGPGLAEDRQAAHDGSSSLSAGGPARSSS